ncbi:MAG: cytochrome c biosis protein CcmA [Proteobacteria bacterium]|nr:cytochrome c biosis protein CcmA [Pseudomonadota bacterium]
MPVMLDVDQLSCQRGERLLFRRLGLTLSAGELLRVTGANGTGKTSLLRLLAGLSYPAAGSVRFLSSPILQQRESFHASLLYLGHAPALNELLTPLENLRFACASAGDAASKTACLAALDRIGLQGQIDLPCSVLSQGQRRRVGLARLFLASRRKLWILDEPFTALDTHAISELAATLDAHCTAGGAVIFSSHQDVSFRTPQRTLDVESFAA